MMYLGRGLQEECGVFAVSGNDEATSFTYYGLHNLQHRGQEAAGIAVIGKNNAIICHKGEGLVTEVFNEATVRKELKGMISIGHVRYATEGGSGYANVQPILLSTADEQIAIAHNGNIINARELKRQLEGQGSIFHATSDTEIIGHLIRRNKGTFIERLIAGLQALDGAFAFTILHDTGLYVARDRYGIRPLSIGKLPNGGYVFSSETCALDIVGATFIRDVEPGEVIHVHDDLLSSYFYTKETTHAMCMMEYVYFSRPDSNIDGCNVHSVRKRTGIELFNEAHIEADIVIGVPDSSISAAIGYAEAARVPYEMGLVKNRYVARTFIQPTQEMRERGVRMKLSAVSSIVKDKRVILIDDSIVRGTTSKRIVQLLKDAGASEVHMRIASPPIKYPCFYGVDTSTFEELIASRMTEAELCEYINADSLSFLSYEGLIKATEKSDTLGANCGNCMACFTGVFPTKLYSSLEEANKGIGSDKK